MNNRVGSTGVAAFILLGLVLNPSACSKQETSSTGDTTAAPAAAPEKKLGIRPNGDTEIQPNLSQVHNEDLKKVYGYIDEHIDEHVENLQRWIRQPSISNSGEGIPESAEQVKGFFEQLGCQESRVYDVGTTEWGAQGNPVVYARCDEGAPRTLVIYWMYDTMPVTQPDVWIAPPFEGRLVEQAPFKKVLIGRGATNSKGPQMAELNAFLSIKASASSSISVGSRIPSRSGRTGIPSWQSSVVNERGGRSARYPTRRPGLRRMNASSTRYGRMKSYAHEPRALSAAAIPGRAWTSGRSTRP